MNDEADDRDRNFLARWSQRKRAAAAWPEPETATEATPVAEAVAEEEFDLASLPKLEDLTESTDITGFLRKGVPEGVKNAALRKSWVLDPAIRNYVNPALDYAYDWNTPGGVPGSSELTAGTDVAKMVLQIMGTISSDKASESDPTTSLLQDGPVATDGTGEIAAPRNQAPDPANEPVRLSEPAEAALSSIDLEASATSEAESDSDQVHPFDAAMQQSVRRHGSAKPKV